MQVFHDFFFIISIVAGEIAKVGANINKLKILAVYSGQPIGLSPGSSSRTGALTPAVCSSA